jgi:multimeric flavodoxin WrbA
VKVSDMALILGISGTPRKGGNSDALVKEILAGAKKGGHQTQTINLRSYVYGSCLGCERCRKERACTGLLDGMQMIYPLIQEAKGLVLVSPTHNYNVSALVKAFLDRLYCFYDFSKERPGPWSSRLAGQDRQAVIGAVAEQNGEEGLGVVMPAMRLPLEALGYQITGQIIASGIFPAGKVKQNDKIMSRGRELGHALGQALAG